MDPKPKFSVGQRVILARVRHDTYRGQVGTIKRVFKTKGQARIMLACGTTYDAHLDNLDPVVEPAAPVEIVDEPAGHTPGPWTAERGRYGNTKDPYHGIMDSDGAFVAYMPGSQNEEEDANARLIAAAPELLAACERFLEEFASDYCECANAASPLMDGKTTCDYCFARAALAKAKGE